MMPSEPDKKMEDLLRTYARKRREDAGEPPEMHPATRRLLQAEATKLRPREATSQPTFWSWFLLRWPRVGFAVGILALLTVVVWNGMLSRNESSSPTLFAKQDQEAKAVSQKSIPARDAMPAPAAPVGGVAEQDKDFAKRPQPEVPAPSVRLLDEVRSDDSLRAAGGQADLKLKEESSARGLRLRQAPADRLKGAEAEAVAESLESQVLVRKLDAGAPTPRVAADQAANRLEPPTTNLLATGVSLAPAPSVNSRGKQQGFTYSAPGAAPPVDSFSQLPLVTQASPATSAVPSFLFPGGPARDAERQRTDLGKITVPAAPSPNTSAVLAFESRNNEVNGGRADLGAKAKNGTTSSSLGDRSQAPALTTGAGEVLLAKEPTPPPALARQYFRFQRLAEVKKPVAAKAAMESSPAGVLATFDFEQDGDRVRVIDSDGSVYAGRFVTGAEIGQARYAEIGEVLKSSVPAGTEASRPASTADASRRYSILAGSSTPTTNRIFRVNGTNRTYGQLVTIEALLSGGSDGSTARESFGNRPADTPALKSARPAAEPVSKPPAAATASAPLLTSDMRESRRLVGKLRVGGSTEVEIIAVPMAK
jgi:hypothetical protein